MIDIVLITTDARPELLSQSVNSLVKNAVTSVGSLTVVVDGSHDSGFLSWDVSRLIYNGQRVGASRSRNIGAGSIPKYRRQKYVLFLDDDVYMCPRWDEKLMELAKFCDSSIISGYSHPFNHCEPMEYSWNGVNHGEPLVISSVAMMMPWSIFDDVGPWDEPGGPGGSEDYALCMRAKDKGYGFAVTEPQCVIHTGLTGSNGKPIVGQKELIEQNEKLIALYGLEGVRFE
jgi:GT2 family glycosyltransferase